MDDGPQFRRSLVQHVHTKECYVLLELPGWGGNGQDDILSVRGPLGSADDWQTMALDPMHHADPTLAWARVQPWRQILLTYD